MANHGGVLNPMLIDGSNFVIGVYWAATGAPTWAMDAAFAAVLGQEHHLVDLYKKDDALGHQGLDYALKNCRAR